MKVADIPFNMKANYSEDFIESPDNREEMLKGINFLLDNKTSDTNIKVQVLLNTLLGHYYRVLGEFDEAVKFIEDVIEYHDKAGEKGVLHLVGAKIRLATTYLGAKKLKKAEGILNEIVAHENKDVQEKYREVALQQLGKVLFKQDRTELALNCFLEAHQILLLKGDMKQIPMCEKAIDYIRHDN
jgi:tetratricopeptide (TPR) repeat protein